MIRECPTPREDCPYYNLPPPPPLRGQEYGCYSDRDHIVPKRLGTTALARKYIRLPINMQQLCRWDHVEKTIRGDEPLPPYEVMDRAVNG